MNEALILLLVIFIQSQSDGILVPNPNTNHHFQDSQLEGWDGGEFPYEEDISEDYKKRSLTNDAFTRRSALDKNFMRFGRGSEAPQEQRRQRLYSSGKLAFYRFIRGLKDNFIRFGRGGEKSGFIRFGRTHPEDFFRAGKSLRENFIRFGKADKNFMRFGRERNNPNYQESLSSGEPFQNTDLSNVQDNFMRFVRASKNGTNLLGFEKEDLDGSDENDQDSVSQKEIKRRRRRTQQEHPMRQPTLTDFTNRNSYEPFQFFHFLPVNFPGRISPGLNGSWQNFRVMNPSRLTPFFPVFPNVLKQTNPFGSATKRDRGNSNFIRTEPWTRKAELPSYLTPVPVLMDCFISRSLSSLRGQYVDSEVDTEVVKNAKKMKLRESKEELLAAKNEAMTLAREPQLRPETSLTPTEKQFLLYAERGDTATVRRLLEQFGDNEQELNINCVDSLRRSALISAIENENIDLIRLLLEWNIKVKDALLHAIKEEYVEAVELLLEWEEKIHIDGQPYSWEAVDSASATFTSDMTPLILAAHKNNYEIIKILLDRGATLPRPHNVRCGCDECMASSEADSLRHSQARINAYRALTASSLIALSSEDPLLTAFELSRELRNLSYCEAEFRAEYKEMQLATQDFATALLNHVRTSSELEEILNFNADGDVWESGERQTLARLKLAIKYKQKKFVAHPNVQQLLASIWYDGLPGFRRKSMARQVAEIVKLACLFPIYSFIYMMTPTSQMALFMKKPFVKFIFHSSSYCFFLMLLGLASQRAEQLIIEWVGNEWLRKILVEWRRKERGSLPGAVEMALFVYVASLIYGEVRALWTDGLREYIADLWNIVDFITNCFYLIWISLRFTAIYIVERESWLQRDPYIPRENWDPFDPILLSEGAFAAGMIFSFLKLVHIFSVNPYLGPLQISLGRMIIDILKFFFIYTLVLFAFGCGMNQLMWYYAKVEKSKCYGTSGSDVPDFENNEKACTVWRRFANLFETSQSLFWASFGLVDLTSFDLTGIKSFTRFWGLLLFGCYSVVNIIVLLNMLIAMMSNSYQIISERSDVEWKFARSRLWMSYFDEGDTLPPPFNLMPTIKTLTRAFRCGSKSTRASLKVKSRIKAQERHKCVINNLIARYVTAEQRKRDDYGITEDDVIEIRHDISTLKYELIHILRTNGMNIPQTNNHTDSLVSKKGKVMERRLIKDFRIGVVEGTLMEALSHDKDNGDVFSKIARVFQKRASKSSKKKDWNALVRRSSAAKDPIGTTEERRERLLKQSLRRYILTKSANVEALDPEKLVEYNPKLSDMIPAVRVAYAKFNINKIRQEYNEEETVIRKAASIGGNASTECPSPTPRVCEDAKPSQEAFRKRPRPELSMNNLSTTFGIPPPPQANQPPSDSTVESPAPTTRTAEQLCKDFRCIPSAADASWADHPVEGAPRENQTRSPAKKKDKRGFGGRKSKVTGEVLSGWL